jgi:hypothetical protein
MRRVGWIVVGCDAVVLAAGCGWGPVVRPPDAAVETIGGEPSGLTLRPYSVEEPQAEMGRAVSGSPGIDRAAWPRRRLEVGRPVLPRKLVPLQNPAECAVGPDAETYWTPRDVGPCLRSLGRFFAGVILLPAEPWRDREAPAPPTPLARATTAE